ncbi:hypothetical protein M758_6G015600 [Ceratodon purpureus]|nr:hypothetical protein M758_6G015600 [Ceratodon purpureus]
MGNRTELIRRERLGTLKIHVGRMITGGVNGLKSLGRWTPCRTLLERRFAQERSPSIDDEKPKKSTATGATSGCQQAQPLKTTARQETKADSDTGEIPTPSLLKATSTKDFILSEREKRLREKSKEKDEEVDVMKLEETFRKGKSTADLDSG